MGLVFILMEQNFGENPFLSFYFIELCMFLSRLCSKQ